MGDAALPVVQRCRLGLEVVSDWLYNVDKTKRTTSADASGLPEAIAALQQALDDFKTNRLQILLPFRHLFDPNHPPIDLTYKVCSPVRSHLSLADNQMSYRGLFQNFVAEYHVVSSSVRELTLMPDGICELLARLDDYSGSTGY